MNCEHDYKVLEKDLEIESFGHYDASDENDVNVKGYIVFYCKKCCNVEKKVVR